ncbi:YhcB family protein [Chromatiaceae bacterium AAb-1]|nr:YhcB family protein [Chromatiaceae bacterium AAb-1]
MDLTLALTGLVVGLIIGALLARFLTLKQFNQHKLQQELNESRQQLHQYRQDVSSHIETTNQLMTQLQDNYSKIARHIAQSKMQLVEQPAQFAEEPDLNYLSGDTAEHIRQSLNQLDEKRRIYPSVEQQPRDYSGESSGLMKDRTINKSVE